MKNFILFIIVINFVFGTDLRTKYLNQSGINCDNFNFQKTEKFNNQNFTIKNLNDAIKSKDVKKVKEILTYNKNLSIQRDEHGKTPFKINQLFGNNPQIEDLLLCANDDVFTLEIYPISILNDKLISDEKTKEILKELFKKGLDANDIFYDFGNGGSSLLMMAYHEKKIKSAYFILENGAKIDKNFNKSFVFMYTQIFRDENLSLYTKAPLSKNLKNFIKTRKYINYRNEKFKELENFLKFGEDIQNYDLFAKVLSYLNDRYGLKKLKDLGYKSDF